MSLTAVKMSEDVWFTCLTHALSTETEEIMGLLLGDIEVTLQFTFPSFKGSLSFALISITGCIFLGLVVASVGCLFETKVMLVCLFVCFGKWGCLWFQFSLF